MLGIFAEDVDLSSRRIHLKRQVQFGKTGPLKDDEARTIPILEPLVPLLAAQKLKVGSTGPLFPTTRKCGGGNKRAPSRFVAMSTLHDLFKEACVKIGRPDIIEWSMPWYRATRHTGASHWVARGGNIATLAMIMGHSTTWVTDRYAHLRPDMYSTADLARLTVDPVSSHYAPNSTISEAENTGNRQKNP